MVAKTINTNTGSVIANSTIANPVRRTLEFGKHLIILNANERVVLKQWDKTFELYVVPPPQISNSIKISLNHRQPVDDSTG